MEETTTETPANNGVEEPTQPVVTQESTAENQDPAKVTEPTEPSTDDNSSWLQSKGIDPSSPEAVAKLAEMARNAEKLMTTKAQEAAELKRSLQGAAPQTDDGMQEFIADYKRDKMLGTFKDTHPDWKEHEPAMAELLLKQSESGYSYGQLVNAGIIPLEAVYSMAKGSANVDAIKKAAQQEVLQSVANKQRAAGNTPNATNSAPNQTGKDFKDLSIAEMEAKLGMVRN